MLTGVVGEDLEGFLADLRAIRGFSDLWDRHDVARACNPVRAVRHPAAGDLVFEVELLDAADGDLQIVVLEPSDSNTRARWSVHVRDRSGGLDALSTS